MTPARFAECLALSHWTQASLAEILRCDMRQVQSWASGEAEIPASVAAWLETLGKVHGEVTPPIGWKRHAPKLPVDDQAQQGVMAAKRKPKAAKPATVSSTILGAAAEHYVMCQLLRQDMIAALAPAGVPNADIVVSDKLGSRVAAIQVKARRELGADGGWHMKKKHTSQDLVSDLLFYCFVDFGTGLADAPKCWVIPSAVVAEVLARSYDAWYSKPGKGGKKHNDHDMRRLLPDYSKLITDKPAGWMDEYRDGWKLIAGRTASL